MRFLILGGDGMLGHRLYKTLRQRHEAKVTLRQEFTAYREYGLFDSSDVYAGIDARNTEALLDVFQQFKPEVLINAVGIVKQRAEAEDAILSIEINALLPHRLAALSRAGGVRLVHVSTDCVFAGLTGNYNEDTRPDPDDLYGRAKLLGEVTGERCLTLRTSLIGTELRRKTGLVEWFLAQRGAVKGYRRAIFTGFTTFEMSRIIERLALDHPHAEGVYHVSSDPISKYELLSLIRDKLGLDTRIIADDTLRCDRSLDSSRFRTAFGYTPPSWDDMIEELASAIKKGTS